MKPMLSVRSPKSVDDFVSGQRPSEVVELITPVREVPAPAPEPIEKSAELSDPGSASLPKVKVPKRMRGVVKRADGTERARVTVYVDVRAAAKLRRHCFENGVDLSEVAGEAVETFVANL